MTNIFRRCYDFIVNGVEYETRPDGSTGSILRYDYVYALSVGCLIPRPGSVFTMRELILVSGGLCVLCTILAVGACRGGNKDGCVSLPEPSTNYLTLVTLCSFVIALFANTVLNRWWEVRRSLQNIMGNSTELMMKVTSILSVKIHTFNMHCEDNHESKIQIRMQAEKLTNSLVGLLVLSFRLLFTMARDDDKSKVLSDMVARDVLSAEHAAWFSSVGCNALNPIAVTMILLHESQMHGVLAKSSFTQRPTSSSSKHQYNHCHHNTQQQQVRSTSGTASAAASEACNMYSVGASETDMAILHGCIAAIRSNTSSVSMHIDCQLPFPFIQIVSSVCYAFLIQLVLVCSSYIAAGLQNDDNASLTTGYMTIVLYTFVLIGLLRLFETLSNPLGDDVADFPGDSYMSRFEETLKSICDNAFALVDRELIFGSVADEDVMFGGSIGVIKNGVGIGGCGGGGGVAGDTFGSQSVGSGQQRISGSGLNGSNGGGGGSGGGLGGANTNAPRARFYYDQHVVDEESNVGEAVALGEQMNPLLVTKKGSDKVAGLGGKQDVIAMSSMI